MTQSARAAALRSTAIATTPGAGRGIIGLGGGCLRQAENSAAEAAADRAQRRAQDTQRREHGCEPRLRQIPRPTLCPPRRDRSRNAPACGVAAAARAQTADAGGGRRDVIDLAGRYGSAGERHRSGAQAQAGGCDPGRGGHLRSGGEEARGMDHPAQRRQRRVGRALSRLHIRQSELALADLPAPAPRGGAVGRPPRRCHRVGMVRERIAAVGQGQILAGAGHDRARRPGQCRASGARRLAQRFHVRGYREHRARSVRRAC